MKKDSTTVIREGLRAFADRRVLQSFTEKKGKDGKTTFKFIYYGNNVLNLEFTEKDHSLTIRNMLPHVPVGMYTDLQAFLESLSDPKLPEYRRVDKKLADAGFVKKAGNVSLVFKVKKNQYKDAVDKLVELVSWIRIYLQGNQQEYLWRVMGEPED